MLSRLKQDLTMAEAARTPGGSRVDLLLIADMVAPGAKVHAGEINLTGPLLVEITAAGPDTFLGELVRLMLVAEQGQSRFIRLADRLARVESELEHLRRDAD